MTTRSDLPAALEQWSRVVGAANVITDGAALSAVESATFRTHQRVPAIVLPANREEVQECVRIANRCRTPIYPVSTGKNWGYGSSVPPRDNTVVLSLRRMNRIVDFDDRLGWVTIEPGVTGAQLFAFLRAKGSRLMAPLVGSTEHASIVGTTIERGVAIAGRMDKFSSVCALEVVLANGDCLHSGFERFAGAKAAKVARWGVGPSVEGLFSQSSLGIVTRMTLFLERDTDHFLIANLFLNDPARLPEVIEALRPLRSDAAFPVDTGLLSLYNDYKVVGMWRQFPWDKTSRVPLGKAELRQVMGEMGFGRWQWSGMGMVRCASSELVQVRKRLIKKALNGLVDQLIIHDDKKMRLARRFRRPYELITRQDLTEFFLIKEGPMFGVPRPGMNVPGTYWRKRTPIPRDMDPDRDRCGVIWCGPVVPFTGEHIGHCVALIEARSIEHGYEPNLFIGCIDQRSVHVVFTIMYDRDIAGEDERAMACHDQINRELLAEGYVPYRLGVQHMSRLPPSADDYDRFVRSLKEALDPNGILAPGRYDFGRVEN